ncbi:Vgb family protein [Nostoc sp.]|uniref:Vgb family protein n=1 Tax=Nostoc sp. TaxID=1180 RepID=UPI002FFAAC93
MHNLSKINLSLTIVVVLSLTTLKAQAALLVSSGDTGSILRYDDQTGNFIDTFVPLGRGGLKRPVGLTFGLDNNLYVSNNDVNNPVNDSVLRYNGQTGDFIDAFIPSGRGGLEHPASLTFGPDGNLYVSSLAGKGIRRYDGKTGAFIDVVDDTVPSGGQNLNVSGLTFGSDNNLYFSTDFPNNGILRYNIKTSAIKTFVPADIAPNIPGGLTFGPDGNLYVGDFSPNGGVARYNGQSGALIDTFVPVGSGSISSPSLGLTFGPDKNFYVSSYGNSSVLRYNGQTGAFINAFVPSGSGGLSSPESLTFSPKLVPEPFSGLGIFAFGAFSVGLVRKRQMKKQ